MRNPNGFGSVFKMSGKRRKPWRAVKDGITIGYFATKTEGYTALGQYKENEFTPLNKLTLKDVYEKLLAAGSFTPGQVKTYHTAWNYLVSLWEVPIINIRTLDMQKILDETYVSKSQSTVKVILALLRKVFAYANEQDFIRKDYTEFLKLPKSDAKQKIPLTAAQIKLIEESKSELKNYAMVLIYMGWRISEFTDLLLEDVDVKEWTIVGGGKTDAGRRRTVPVHEKIQPIIKKWFDNNSVRLVEYEGKRVLPNYFRDNLFKPLMEELKIENVTPHNLRHTCATLLAKAGASTKAIQLIMGHAEYSTTAQTYTMFDLEDLRAAIKTL